MSVFKFLKIPLIVSLCVLVVDQISKIWVKTNMLIGESSHFHWDWNLSWAQLYFVENEGMAFGMEFAGEYGKLALSLFRIVAICLIGWYIFITVKKNAPKGLIIALSLIFSGALGNIIDSAFYGMIFNESPYVGEYAYFNNETEKVDVVRGYEAKLFPADGGYASFLHGKVVDMLHFPLIEGRYPKWFPFWGGEDFIFFRPVFNIADSAITIGVLMILLFQRRYFSHKKS